MNIHPLAELFPLIEGKEFDDLVASIRESGQLEPIVTLKGAILDGRNRYRACEAAQVEPHTEEFTGTDPLQFVICKNINRRHLNESQRALLAARFATLRKGDVATQKERGAQICAPDVPPLTGEEASKLFNVSMRSVTEAKKVLREGTPEEIESVKNGQAAVYTVAENIRQMPRKEDRPPPAELLASKNAKANSQRSQTLQMQADIWRRLKEALDHLTGLPLPSDVVAIARVQDKKTKGMAIEQRLNPAMEWLMEFSDAWNARRD